MLHQRSPKYERRTSSLILAKTIDLVILSEFSTVSSSLHDRYRRRERPCCTITLVHPSRRPDSRVDARRVDPRSTAALFARFVRFRGGDGLPSSVVGPALPALGRGSHRLVRGLTLMLKRVARSPGSWFFSWCSSWWVARSLGRLALVAGGSPQKPSGLSGPEAPPH